LTELLQVLLLRQQLLIRLVAVLADETPKKPKDAKRRKRLAKLRKDTARLLAEVDAVVDPVVHREPNEPRQEDET